MTEDFGRVDKEETSEITSVTEWFRRYLDDRKQGRVFNGAMIFILQIMICLVFVIGPLRKQRGCGVELMISLSESRKIVITIIWPYEREC